jgi:hypothetical protein
MDVLQQLIRQPLLNAEAMPRVLDLLWSRLGGLNGKFFEAGWGNLGIVNLEEDLQLIKQWPPKDMQVSSAAAGEWFCIMTSVHWLLEEPPKVPAEPEQRPNSCCCRGTKLCQLPVSSSCCQVCHQLLLEPALCAMRLQSFRGCICSSRCCVCWQAVHECCQRHRSQAEPSAAQPTHCCSLRTRCAVLCRAVLYRAVLCRAVQINWKLLQQGSWEGTPYKLFEGSFRWVC